ncbi:MAG: ABC transporter substrate-binding protein [Deltaproteobacteria bacterium]|nr:ABC transporter substrate-binding protein [Deltaproteobacteria bacterium]
MIRQICVVVLAATISLVTACKDDDKKDKIIFGHVTSVTGPFAGTSANYSTVYNMWRDDVNADGGIYVEKYDKKLPIEIIVYDDESNVENSGIQTEKAIVEDEVDLLLPPIGTEAVYYNSQIANNHGYLLIAPSGGAAKLKEIISDMPYFFSMLQFADTQMPALAKILKEEALGVTKVGIAKMEEIHGIEYLAALEPALVAEGIDYVVKPFAPATTDFTSYFSDFISEGVDAFVAFSYPSHTTAMIQQAQQQQINAFKVFFATVLIASPAQMLNPDNFGGPDGIQGIMGAGAWNSKSSTAAKAFEDAYIAKYNARPAYWGALPAYATVQIIQKAIEEVGLDQKKMRDFIAGATVDNPIDTAMGGIYFVGGMNQTYAGQIGQWQKDEQGNSIFEVVDADDLRTADPIIKPNWP